MIYRAHTVVTLAGPPLEDGAVAIDGEFISAVGSFRELQKRETGEVVDLGEVVLLPGLINAHCHLDFTALRGKIAPQRSFADWIRQINGLRRELTDDDYLSSIAAGFREAARWGTTTIANIESVSELLPRLTPAPLRTWWFLELIDVRPEAQSEDLVARAVELGRSVEHFGLSPHAPYTASARLSQCAAEQGLPLTIHLAESREEMEMFRDGRGPLFELLRYLGRPLDDCGAGRTPLATMLARQPLDERWLVVHLNELDEDDFAQLARGPRFHIAHCPRSGRYFGHAPFALERLRALGFNICLGTDSLASNSSLSLFSEMRAVRAAHPELLAVEILEMATRNGARALGASHILGQIAPGCLADLIALPLTSNPEEIYEQIIEWRDPVPWILVGGRAPEL